MTVTSIHSIEFQADDARLQEKIAQLSALSHVMCDEDWTDVIRAPLNQLAASLGAEIARLTAAQ